MMQKTQKYRKYDHFLTGIAAGLAFPFAAYGILIGLSEVIEANTRIDLITPQTLMLLALCTSLIPLHFFKRNYMNQALRGLVFPFLLLAGYWLWMFRYRLGL